MTSAPATGAALAGGPGGEARSRGPAASAAHGVTRRGRMENAEVGAMSVTLITTRTPLLKPHYCG
ncbi:hypothetical protein GCM10009634_69750 [Saccharothrix xinjiangensis]